MEPELPEDFEPPARASHEPTVGTAVRALIEALLVVGLCVLLPVVPTALILSLDKGGSPRATETARQGSPQEDVPGAVGSDQLEPAGEAELLRLDGPGTVWALLVQGVIFIGVGTLLRRRLGSGPEEERKGLATQLVIGLEAGGAALLGSVVLSLSLSALGMEPQEQAWIKALAQADGVLPLLFLVLAVLVVPLGEELLFRGYAFERIRRGAGTALAYGVSSLLFAVVHVNPSAIVLYLYLGLVMAWAYHRSGGLVAAVVAHALNNGVAFLLLLAASTAGAA